MGIGRAPTKLKVLTAIFQPRHVRGKAPIALQNDQGSRRPAGRVRGQGVGPPICRAMLDGIGLKQDEDFSRSISIARAMAAMVQDGRAAAVGRGHRLA